jgi:hypothetical protein
MRILVGGERRGMGTMANGEVSFTSSSGVKQWFVGHSRVETSCRLPKRDPITYAMWKSRWESQKEGLEEETIINFGGLGETERDVRREWSLERKV